MRSNILLQSVAMIDSVFLGRRLRSSLSSSGVDHCSLSGSGGGNAENAGGNQTNSSSAFRQGHATSLIHAQYSRTHDNISTVPAYAIASAERVLTATF